MKGNKWWIASAIIITSSLLGFILGLYLNKPKTREKVVTKKEYVNTRDTIVNTVIKGDTIFIKGKDTHTIHTKLINDTVYIKDEPLTYADSTKDYTFHANAVKLNWYKVDIHHRDTITLRDTTRIVDIQTVKEKRNPLSVGFGAGVGYGLFTKKPDIFIGINISWRLK